MKKLILLFVFVFLAGICLSQSRKNYIEVPGVNSKFRSSIPAYQLVHDTTAKKWYVTTRSYASSDSLATVIRDGYYYLAIDYPAASASYNPWDTLWQKTYLRAGYDTVEGDVFVGKSFDTVTCKVYRARLTQSGTNAPVATEMENTISDTIGWYYTDVGNYYITMPYEDSQVPATVSIISQSWAVGPSKCSTEVTDDGTYMIVYVYTDTYVFDTDHIDLQATNSILNNTYIEIRVYPLSP